MNARPLFLILLAAGLFSSCGHGDDKAAREMELTYLRTLMPEDLLPIANVEVAGIENIAILGEGADTHLGLHLFPGQKKRNGGIRAEVSVNFPFHEGDTVRYAWRFMVPKGFVSDAPKNRWWIIGQWHDQPNPTRGETWDGFPSRSPPVLLALGELEGKLGIAVAYGPDQSQKHGPILVEPGRWHSLAVDIHWSTKADGKAVFFLDDMAKPVATATGANMHNDFQHFLKLGMYRHPEIETDNWIYVDDLQITKR